MALDRCCDLSLSSERDQAACRSWVSLLVLPEDHLLLAQVYEADDGSTPRMRVLVRRANGNLSEVRRSQGKRSWTLKAAPPCNDLLRRAKVRGLLTPPTVQQAWSGGAEAIADCETNPSSKTPSIGSVGR